MHILVPYGGLCNRLRCVLTGWVLSRDEGRAVRIAWGRDAECAAWFEDLFEPLRGENFCVTHRPFSYRRGQKRDLYLPRLMRRLMRFEPRYVSMPAPTEERRKAFAETFRTAERMYAALCYDYATFTPDDYALLRPQPRIMQKVEALTCHFTPETIGVHIRRTDNVASIAHSRDEDFRRLIEKHLQTSDEARVFLATDAPVLKRELCEAFGERILTFEAPTMARSDLQGMESAVIDLFCLAQTREIFGSFASSFTEMAAAWRGIPLITVKS